MNNFKTFVLLTALLMGCVETSAREAEKEFTADTEKNPKKERTIILWGHVRNSFTKQGVLNAKITLMTSDSIVIDSIRTWRNTNDKAKVDAAYRFFIPAKPAKYIILAQHPEYEDCYVDHEVKYIARNTFFDAKWHNMRRKNPHPDLHQMLDQVVVKATKVKIAYKGDTVVFNADAFNMPEGSMLDALVKQLPGAELKEDGQIFVNGRKIDNLTLNGKDFFRGDNKVMLDNLPNYMVEEVSVYNKSTEKSEWLGIDVEKKEYTMDVRLKREYSIGYIANAALGGGTEERYKGRLFGLRFTTNSRLTLFADLNNVNETRSPGSEGQWDPTKLSTDEIALKKVGASLLIDRKDKVWMEKAQITAGFVDRTAISHITTESFLNSGNVFSRAENWSKSKAFEIAAANEFTLKKPFWLRTMLQFHYANSDEDRHNRNAQFSANPALFGTTPQILDSVYSRTQSAELASILTTRLREERCGESKNYMTDFNVNFGYKLPWGDDIDIYANTGYNWTNGDTREVQSADRNIRSMVTDYRNKYYDRKSKDLSIDSEAKYTIHQLNNWNYSFYTKFFRSYNYSDFEAFRLDLLDGWGADNIHDIHSLPSTRDSMLLAIDANNSNELSGYRTKYIPGTRIYYNKEGNGESTWFCIDLPFHTENRKCRYTSPLTDTLVSRRNLIPTPLVEYTRQTHNYGRRYYAKYGMSYNLPGMSHFVDVRNDLDPMNIYVGNPNLKPAISHEFVLEYSIRKRERNQNLALGMNAWLRTNSIANGYTYNPHTGVRTYRSENVNGNWSTYWFVNFGRDIDKQKRWNWQTRTSLSYHRNVDIASTEGTANSNDRLSKVNNWLLYQYLRLAYQWGDIKLGANGTMQHRTLTSQRQNFQTIHTWDFNYGLTCEYQMPLKLQLATDMKMYSRRGYGDSSMNTNDLVWNASLTRPLLNGRMLLKVEGYDLLNQLSAVYNSYNAQGRSETWCNSIPSYVMLHLTWKINVQPRKRL